MSQHTFIHADLKILCGWDRPLQGYFLVIEKDGFDEPYYSNLYEDNPHPSSFDVFLIALSRFGIDLPEGLIEALEQDKSENIGNALTAW